MTLLNVILKILLIALCGFVVFLVYKLCVFLYDFSYVAVPLIGFGIEKISYPFKALLYPVKRAGEFLEDLLIVDPFMRLSRRRPFLGSARAIRFFCLSLILIGILIVVYACNGNLIALFRDTFYMMPFFFILQLFNHEVPFTIIGLISAGVSGMIIGTFFNLCMGDYRFNKSIKHRLVSLIYYTVTTFVACYLGFILSNVWDWFGKTGVKLFGIFKDFLMDSNWSLGGILKFLGCIIMLSLIIYIGIILFATAVKEYLGTFCYGLMGFAIFIAFEIVCMALLPKGVRQHAVYEVIEYILAFACVLIPDYMRVSSEDDEKREKEILKHVKKSSIH